MEQHDEGADARHTLRELAETAGVSIRTVRYYIAEGLLPPPEGSGPRSAYAAGSLDRLRLIGRFKDAYLPLREIRRRLDGLDDAAVRDVLHRLGPPANAQAPEPPTDPDETPSDSAANYLARLREQSGPPIAASGETARFVGERRRQPEDDKGDKTSFAAPSFSAPPRPDDSADEPPDPTFDLDPALALWPAPVEESGEGVWRRIRLGADAELLVRENAYARRRDRVDWLVGWARKVFGS